jgi:hypothetical protein
MGLGLHGAHPKAGAPLGGGVLVKDSTPRAVLVKEEECSYINSYFPLLLWKEGMSTSRNPRTLSYLERARPAGHWGLTSYTRGRGEAKGTPSPSHPAP